MMRTDPPGSTSTAIYAEGLAKTFSGVRALDGIDLQVPRGTVLGLLGPNGAGKTTTVRVLTTLLRPDSGRAVVAGVDVVKDPGGVRRRIGVSGQFAAVDEYLTGRENLHMVGRLYRLSSRAARVRAGELLEQFGLGDAADRVARSYSGGMRRRLDLAAALLVSPPVLFLDEPTAGLDPPNRMMLWDTIRQLVRTGTTVLLTTQYLEEADFLADSVCVIDHGRVIARGSPDELKAETGGDRIEVVVHHSTRFAAAEGVLQALGAGRVAADLPTRRLAVAVTGGAKALAEALRQLDAAGIEIDDIALTRPTLDDVFLSLTGHTARTPAGAGPDEIGRAAPGLAAPRDARRRPGG
ncbi:ATP-binding cassette domain-containing protein [Streptomyces sp. NPDC056069]|uniref:ATP-binding cassette domain-containing protein n=1 Tax=Streptomyces sp. NPDC056069 TaxID=3345702 RepID=UPI0035DECCD2